MKRLALIWTLLAAGLFARNTVGIDINNNDVELSASVNLNRLTDYSTGTAYILEADYLHSGGNLLTLSFSGENALPGIPGLRLAFGLQSAFADSFFALPLYAKADYTLPTSGIFPKSSLIASLVFAPSVLSFRDAKSYNAFRIEGDVEVIANVHLFAGYRNIDTNYNAFDKTFNDSWYGGLRLSF